jgi:hypothetical protein
MSISCSAAGSVTLVMGVDVIDSRRAMLRRATGGGRILSPAKAR